MVTKSYSYIVFFKEGSAELGWDALRVVNQGLMRWPALPEHRVSMVTGWDPATEGAAPLMVTVQSDQRELVRWLLSHGADPNARDHRGFTALHRAAELGREPILRMLLDVGAGPRLEAQGHTARSLAEKSGHPKIVKMLGG